MDIKWHLRFLDLSNTIAEWSRDPSTKVGAVIVRPDKTIASVGYNGLARGVEDTDERLNNRELKYPLTMHAELNAILSAREPLAGYTMYTSMHPCTSCASAMIQAGVGRVVTRAGKYPDRWAESFSMARTIFREAGIEFLEVNTVEVK